MHRLARVETVRNDSELDQLPTEAWDPAGANLDLRSTAELVAAMNEADAEVPRAVARAQDALVAAIDAVAARLAGGGRLVYAGAGTSGRLALVDAVECQSTFGLPPGRVVALVAGGAEASATAQEHAEDDAGAAPEELRSLGLSSNDAVVAISASGRTPYALGALEKAARVGALTVAVTCVEGSALGALADHDVAVVVGSELIAGSTRLKAGTAQKLVLNAISTISMVRLGKTFGNLMVDVVATNEKLRERVRTIVGNATGAPRDRVDAALEASGGDAKVAIVMLELDVDGRTARARLDGAGGVVRRALEP
jgi:N-acetylmuramic acid 6-phosphate etherase